MLMPVKILSNIAFIKYLYLSESEKTIKESFEDPSINKNPIG